MRPCSHDLIFSFIFLGPPVREARQVRGSFGVTAGQFPTENSLVFLPFCAAYDTLYFVSHNNKKLEVYSSTSHCTHVPTYLSLHACMHAVVLSCSHSRFIMKRHVSLRIPSLSPPSALFSLSFPPSHPTCPLALSCCTIDMRAAAVTTALLSFHLQDVSSFAIPARQLVLGKSSCSNRR